MPKKPIAKRATKTAIPLRVRALAAQALAPVLAGRESLSDTLPSALAAVAPVDRGLLQAITFTVCRYAILYRQLLTPLLQRPPQPIIESLLFVGLAQIRDLRIPDHAALSETVEAARQLGQERATGMVNAVLRRYLREKDELEAKAVVFQHAHPEWLRDRLIADWGLETAEAIMAANNREAPLTLRVNIQQATRTDYLARLGEQEITAVPCAYSDAGIRVEGVSDVRALPGFAAGALSVQDEAAQMTAPLLECESGMRVLDACAAPGGKTAHLLEMTKDLNVTALDIDAARCARIEENLARLQLNATVIAADAAQPDTWWDGKPYDRILLDAPCTATGVIRRHPDIKLLRRATDVAQTVKQQAALLKALWPLLVPGGKLLYATCSQLKDENEQQIADFLKGQPDAEALALAVSWGELRPVGRQLFAGETDGFYYALLEKCAL